VQAIVKYPNLRPAPAFSMRLVEVASQPWRVVAPGLSRQSKTRPGVTSGGQLMRAPNAQHRRVSTVMPKPHRWHYRWV
jgi:hypothetical protein